MKISNVVEIFDNGEFITLVTKSGTAVHLPEKGEHSITCLGEERDAGFGVWDVNVDFYSQ